MYMLHENSYVKRNPKLLIHTSRSAKSKNTEYLKSIRKNGIGAPGWLS